MLEQKINELKENLFLYAQTAEKMIEKSIRALTEKNMNLAKEVVEKDEPLSNKTELEIDNFAIELMARYQPEASYLRNIVMIIKINNDVERIADHAVNISQRGIFQLIPYENIGTYTDIQVMAEKCVEMFKNCIEAYKNNDAEKAIKICREDTVINSFRNKIIQELIKFMLDDPKMIERAIALIMVTKDLERVADLTTNIAEDIVYVVAGIDIRHHNKSL